MAASATTISSYMSTINTHLTSKSITSPPIRVSAPRAPRMHSMLHLSQQLYTTHITPKPRIFGSILAAVSQEEAAATAVEEEATATAVEEEAAATAVEEEAVAVEEVQESEAGGEEAAPVEEQPQQNTKLYFGNLPYNCDSSQLAGLVQEYATPEMVEVLYDRNTGRSRGFAFVTMSTVEDCEAVIQNLDGSQFNGRTMRVNFSDKPRAKEPLYKESEYKLFVGNLSWNTTSEDLQSAFAKCGKVVSARVLIDGDTGRSRGYGFVCYSTKEEMEEALESLDGEEIDGRGIRVSPAEGRRN